MRSEDNAPITGRWSLVTATEPRSSPHAPTPGIRLQSLGSCQRLRYRRNGGWMIPRDEGVRRRNVSEREIAPDGGAAFLGGRQVKETSTAAANSSAEKCRRRSWKHRWSGERLPWFKLWTFDIRWSATTPRRGWNTRAGGFEHLVRSTAVAFARLQVDERIIRGELRNVDG